MEEMREETKDCPKCGRQMRVRHRRSDGQAFWGCTGFSTEECRYAEDYQGDGTGNPQSGGTGNPQGGGAAQTTEETRDCPQCGKPMRVRHRRSDGQPFWGCSGYTSGECRYAEDYTEGSS